jgi:hypothetical protein
VTPVERRFGGRSRGPVASSSNQTRARVLNVGIPLIFIPVTARPATAFPRGVWDCYSVCTDSGPISLWASWSMHIEAMNFGGMGHAEDATMLGRVRCASDAIASTNPATKWTGEASFIRVPGFD